MDVRHARLVRVEHHAVDHADQRVVRLLDRRVFFRRVLKAFLLQRMQQFLGLAAVELDRLQRVARSEPAFGGGADLFVRVAQRAVELQTLREHRHGLHLRDEFDLVHGRAPVGRIVERHHQAAFVNHQRHDLQPHRRRIADLAQRLGLGRKHIHVDQRIAHLAGQRDLQLRPRHGAGAHQQLAQRRAAFQPLLRQRVAQLLAGDHAERSQRLADADQRHLRLVRKGGEQLRRRDHDAREKRFVRYRIEREFAGGAVRRRAQGERRDLDSRCRQLHLETMKTHARHELS